MYVIATGNAFDGLELTGPFYDHEAAVQFAEDGRNSCDEWSVVKINELLCMRKVGRINNAKNNRKRTNRTN